jgi:hypothetical protein
MRPLGEALGAEELHRHARAHRCLPQKKPERSAAVAAINLSPAPLDHFEPRAQRRDV